MLIVSLVKEDVFSVLAVHRVLLQDPVGVDPVFFAYKLPEFISD